MTGRSARGWWVGGLVLVLGCSPSADEAMDDHDGDATVDGSEGAAGGSAEGGEDGDGEDATASVGPTGGGDTATPCSGDGECDDGNDCTVDACDVDGELGGVCRHTPEAGCDEGSGGAGAGDIDGSEDPDPPTPGGPDDPIDGSCDDGPQSPVFLPYEPLGPVDLPASCDGGFEWQVCQSSIVLDAPGGSAAGTLVVDLATYTMPDRLRIVGERADGSSYVLMDTCRVRTAEYADPTDGHTRPPEDSIRRFELDLEAGTRSLTIDATQASTPYYVRVLGLCAFDLAADGETCGSYRSTG